MSAADNARSCVVFDFETTGLSPAHGDRAIEIGAVRLERGAVVDRFQALMQPGRRISSFIEEYTGITNAMLADAESCEAVMARFADFADGACLVAHNASFDRKFLEAEYARIGKSHSGRFACSMLAARRLCQQAPNHRLGTLVEYLGLPTDGTFHRALADAEMTAELWLRLVENLGSQSAVEISFSSMTKLCSTSKAKLSEFVRQLGAA